MAIPGGLKIVVTLAALPFLLFPATGIAQKEKKSSRLEGEFRISVSGREIGFEKYTLAISENAITSSSVLELRISGEGNQKIALSTKLEMDEQYNPRSYELQSEVNGKRGTIKGSFAPNQVIFDYVSDGNPVRNGLLLGDRCTVLDTNIFHHFIFLARLFKYGSREKSQTFEVVIPQEKETGTLLISELNKESIEIKGKKISTTHLLIDSGSMRIHMWVDSERTPRKISVPEKGIEVLQNN